MGMRDEYSFCNCLRTGKSSLKSNVEGKTMTKEESLRLEQILKKIDKADETNCKKEEEYNSFCTNTREDWNEEQYQKLKKEKILTEAAYFASLIELKAEVKCMLNQ